MYDPNLHPAERGLNRPPLAEPPGREPGQPWRPFALLRAFLDALRAPRTSRFDQLRAVARVVALPLLLFVGAFVVYALFSWNRFNTPSDDTHFAYLAHTFLDRIHCDGVHGEGFHRPDQGTDRPRPRPDDPPPEGDVRCERAQRLEMPIKPPHGNDWASFETFSLKGDDHQEMAGFFTGESFTYERHKYEDFRTLDGDTYFLKRRDIDHRRARDRKHFVSFPPMPAVLMMPIIAAADADKVDLHDPKKLGINDVRFTVFFAALNVALCFLLLQHLSRLGISHRSRRDNLILTLLFGFGTNILWCAILGQVWFTALIVGITFTFLYIFAAIDTRHPLLAGLALGCAMACRTPLAFSFVFFAWFLFFPNGRLRQDRWGEMLLKGVLFSLPILAIGGWLMWMNHTRFADPFEFGHRYLALGRRPEILKYGLFNYHFLSKNLTAAFTMLPRLQPYAPYALFSEHGMSLFLTTPPLLYLLAYRSGHRPLDRKWQRALILCVLAVAIPGLFYQNTGWRQYGFRFSLDYTPYLVILLALNRRRLSPLFCQLAFVGFLVNGFGAVTFGRAPEHYESHWIIDPDVPRQPPPKKK